MMFINQEPWLMNSYIALIIFLIIENSLWIPSIHYNQISSQGYYSQGDLVDL